jgi:nucleoside diphosphate kinase
MKVAREVCIAQIKRPDETPQRPSWQLNDACDEPTRLFVSGSCARSLGIEDCEPGTAFDQLDANNWALCIIKPDARKQGLESKIDSYIGNKVVRSSVALQADDVTLTLAMLDKIWPAPLDESGNVPPPSPWWVATVEYMTSAPVHVRLIHGVGATASMLALKAHLRQTLYGAGYQSDRSLPVSERVRSVIHTSDCDQELVGNLLAFWTHSDIRDAVTRERGKSL